jgi:hypothetical protein
LPSISRLAELVRLSDEQAASIEIATETSRVLNNELKQGFMVKALL